MLILFAICMTGLTMYIDAVACLTAKHKYNWKASFISAIFWPMLWVVVIMAVIKETKDY